jgi:hypothetical protein
MRATVPTIGADAPAARYHRAQCRAIARATPTLAKGKRAMADLSKRYNHDGISFLAFTPGLSMPYCAHFSASQRGGEAGRAARH